ncbi:MAG: Fic family protein, partial [Actinomycetota bacterium]
FELVAAFLLDNGRPITESLIREIHRSLVEGVRGGESQPGRYRTVQNQIVNSTTGEVLYVPPPPHDVAPLMQELVAWLGGVSEVHPVLVAGIAQFQLVHIHPFVDGNGRTSRLLSTLCLYRSGYDFKRLFTLSEYYDRDRVAFYRALQSVREDMDLTGWLEYFVVGLAAQLNEVVSAGRAVIRRDALAREHGLNERQRAALGFLLEHGTMQIHDYQVLAPGVHRKTLQRDLRGLMESGLVTSSGSSRAVSYQIARGAR